MCVGAGVCLYALHTSPITHTHLLGLLSSWNISGIPTDESVLCPLLFFATSPFPVVKHIRGPPTTSPSVSAELRDDPSHQTSLGWFVGIRSLLLRQNFKPSPHCLCLSLSHLHTASTKLNSCRLAMRQWNRNVHAGAFRKRQQSQTLLSSQFLDEKKGQTNKETKTQQKNYNI